MVQYFARSLAKETDLSVELRYMQRFEATFAGHPFVHIPKIYAEYSNRYLLVQEYIGDKLLKNVPSESLAADTRRMLANRITDTLFTMILQQGFFHADPHPGNIFINEEGGITLIDFGLVGHLSSTRRREIIDLINALTHRDQFTMQYVLSNWAQGELPDENLLGADVLEMLLNYEHTPMRDLRISQVINDITQIMRQHGLTLPGDLVMLFKTLITLEGVVKKLDGSAEMLEQAKPIVAEVFKARASPEHILRKSKMHAQTLLQSLDELPQLFNVVFRGDLSLVGPRPHAIGSLAGNKMFWEVDSRYWQRHSLKPGMSGLAQIRGFRGATDHEQDLVNRLHSDLEYLEGWTIFRDLRIVAMTLNVVVHDRAY